jgi:hypothetical protein
LTEARYDPVTCVNTATFRYIDRSKAAILGESIVEEFITAYLSRECVEAERVFSCAASDNLVYWSAVDPPR